jgi:hypothetical protein
MPFRGRKLRERDLDRELLADLEVEEEEQRAAGLSARQHLHLQRY